MTISEAATQVLFGQSLSEKLAVSPLSAPDSRRPAPLKIPVAPVREAAFALSEKGVRAPFPGVNRLDETQARGELLHFLANHELLAAELMALVLLKFPHAPLAYRRGVYEAMREEQMHTRMYMRRMKQSGLEFGQLPLNSYFWRLVSPMKSPAEFVTKLNLTFEQANLDFSHYYAKRFHEVGDHSTAAVLEKIYRDEISHVGHGIRWFRHWKSPDLSDWEAFESVQSLPFSAAKAKGNAPFNWEGRRAAGLDEQFIKELSVYRQSRGRSPILHWFNPHAEFHARLASQGGHAEVPKTGRSLESDLELLMMGVCRNDDLLLLRKRPTNAHLRSLERAGFTLPELVAGDEGRVSKRGLGGLMPWAWSPEAARTLQPFAKQVSPRVEGQWREANPPSYFSKQLGPQLEALLKLDSESQFLSSRQTAVEAVNTLFEQGYEVKLKGAYGCAGQGQWTLPKHAAAEEVERRIETLRQLHGGVIVEPFYERVADFSVLYEMGSEVRLKGYSILKTTPSGAYRASLVSQKWSRFLPPEVQEMLIRGGLLPRWYQDAVVKALPLLLPEYRGPVGIDALVYRRPDRSLALKVVLEVNVRLTMGRVALGLLKQRNDFAGELSIGSVGSALSAAQIPLNDPSQAQRFQASWQPYPPL